MFESYRRIKLFLSKKKGDFIHDLEQSFFALVNASRDPNVPFFSSSEYSVFSYLSNSVLLASPFADLSLAAYGAYVCPMPYSNEVGSQMLTGGAAREAAVLGIMAILVTATNVEILMNILGINLVRLVALASGNTSKNPIIKLGRAFLGVCCSHRCSSLMIWKIVPNAAATATVQYCGSDYGNKPLNAAEDKQIL
ncbi:hypothetical protein S83_067005 [Arachis hypogaea]